MSQAQNVFSFPFTCNKYDTERICSFYLHVVSVERHILIDISMIECDLNYMSSVSKDIIAMYSTVDRLNVVSVER